MISTKELYEIFKSHPVISTDSRNIIPGSIFIALKGPSFNGNSFAEMAIEKGAAFAVIDDIAFQKNQKYLLVEDGLKALQDLANFHRRQFNFPFLAITGSNGKTTTKELIRNVLSKKFKVTATKGNLNNHIGVPLTLLSITNETQFAVIEMGANHLHEIESYCKIAEPDYGLITNVGKAHLEGFGGFEGVKKGKGELYEWVSKKGKGIFLNSGNEHLKKISAQFSFGEVISYGTGNDVYCSGELTKQQPQLNVNWKCKSNSGEIKSQLIGTYNFENILSAICIGNYFGVSPGQINEAIENYVPDNSRSQVMKRGNNTIILDAYNANPTSMEAALNNFRNISTEKKIIFLGEMAELGKDSNEEHKRLIASLQETKFDKIILVGENFKELFNQVTKLYFENSEKAATWLKENPVENSYILIKGSRSSKMERILEAL